MADKLIASTALCNTVPCLLPLKDLGLTDSLQECAQSQLHYLSCNTAELFIELHLCMHTDKAYPVVYISNKAPPSKGFWVVDA